MSTLTLSKKDILAADDLKQENVAVPEWGGDVIIRELTGQERSDWESDMFPKRPKTKNAKEILETADMTYAREKLLARCMIDGDGNHLFTVTEITEIAKKSASVLNRLYKVASELNGMAANSEEEAVGN